MAAMFSFPSQASLRITEFHHPRMLGLENSRISTPCNSRLLEPSPRTQKSCDLSIFKHCFLPPFPLAFLCVESWPRNSLGGSFCPPRWFGQGSGEGGPVSWDVLGDVDMESFLGKDLYPEWSRLSNYPLPSAETETKVPMFPGHVFSHSGAGITGCRCEESQGLL